MGDDPHAAAGDAELADDGGVGATEDFADFAFQAAGGTGVCNPHHGAVAVHDAADGFFVQVNVAADARDRTVRNEKTEAVPMDADAAGDVFAVARGGDVVACVEFDDLPSGGEAVHGRVEGVAIVATQAEILIELFEAGAAPRLFRDVVEQRGVRHSFIIEAMRSHLFTIPSLLLAGAVFGQSAQAQTPPPAASHKKSTPEHKAAPMTMPIRNFKLSGSPAAPLTVELFTDYECPSCRNFYMQVLPQLEKEYVATGKIQLMHRDYRLPQHQFSKLATRFANAAGQLGPEQYKLVAGQLFEKQQEWSANGNVDAAVAKVLSPSDMAKVREMVKSDSHLEDSSTADEKIAAADGLNQTPTLVIVNKGKRTKIDGFVPFNILKSYLDQMLAKG